MAEEQQQPQMAMPMFPVGNYLIVVGSFNFLNLNDEDAIEIHFLGGEVLELTAAESFELKQRMGLTRVEAAPTGLGSFVGH
jgi:hypothetical protein